MKYKIRKTGEIIDVVSYSGLTSTERDEIDDWVDYIDSNGNEIKHAQLNLYWDLEPIQIESAIDWEQRRYEIAKEAMWGLLYNNDDNLLGIKLKPSDLVEMVLVYTDALIAELKKGQNTEDDGKAEDLRV